MVPIPTSPVAVTRRRSVSPAPSDVLSLIIPLAASSLSSSTSALTCPSLLTSRRNVRLPPVLARIHARSADAT